MRIIGKEEKKILITILLTLIFISIVMILINNNNVSEKAIAKSKMDGLKEGFDEGFTSGSQFGIGASDGMYNQTPRENATWYYMQGYNLTSIDNYMITKDLNPYK